MSRSQDNFATVYDGAATAAIESLPAVTGEIIQPLALPAPTADIREQVRALADTLNGKNWQTVKKELLKLAN